jgi:hypothetical protein
MRAGALQEAGTKPDGPRQVYSSAARMLSWVSARARIPLHNYRPTPTRAWALNCGSITHLLSWIHSVPSTRRLLSPCPDGCG